MKVLITGHRGIVGNIILPRFADDEVVGYDIQDGNDIFDRPRLLVALEGCTAVVHLAAYGNRLAAETWEEFQRLNVEGTKQVFQAAAQAGVLRFVYCSTGNVYCQEGGDPWRDTLEFPIDVDAVPDLEDPRLPYYPRSKLVVESWLKWQRLWLGRLEVVILRPNWLGEEPCSDDAWGGAHVTDKTLAEGFYQACRVVLPRPFLILDLIEPNEDYKSTSEMQELLLCSR